MPQCAFFCALQLQMQMGYALLDALLLALAPELTGLVEDLRLEAAAIMGVTTA